MATRYALWLSPAAEAIERWQALIVSLSVRLGTPTFEPHVTLIGAVTGDLDSLREKTRLLALELEPLTLRLGPVKYLDEFYRCLFAEVETSRPLADAHAAAQRRFGSSAAAYYPHLSLVYGDLTQAQKQTVIADIGSRVDEPLCVDHLLLIEAPDGPDSWRRRERVALGGDDSTI